MPVQVNIHEAKTHLSSLINRVSTGEEITIAKAGKTVARIVPVEREKKKKTPGNAKGTVIITDDFDAPLPDEILAGFEK